MERQTIKKPLNGSNNYMGRPFEQKNTLQDVSFSSYLSSRPEPPPPKQEDNNRFTVDDSDQISVFEAENYFSEKDHNNNNNNKRDSSSTANHHDKTAQQRGGCESSAISRLSSVSSTDGYGYGGNKLRARSFNATPTASSEASWNSQTGLLSKPQGSIPISLRNIPASDHDHTRRNGGYSSSNAGTKWFLGLKCPCYGKNCVQVEENSNHSEVPKTEPKTSFTSSTSSSYPKRHISQSINHPHSTATNDQSVQSQTNPVTKKSAENNPEQVALDYRSFSSESHFPTHDQGHQQPHRRRRHHHNRQQGLGSFRDGVVGFSFPILNQSLPNVKVQNRSPMDDPPRESLEVFQPPDDSMEVHQQQRRGAFGFPMSPMSRITGTTEEEGGSDASSDLFEIESFSAQTTSYRRRDSLDDDATASYGRGRQSLDEPVTPSVAATECYEPSEASINWSVTTAEGFDRGSVGNFSISASEFGDVANMRRQEAADGGGGGWSRRRSGGGNGGGGLLLSNLSCRWEKAVSVGPTQQQQGKWGQEDGGGGGGERRVVGGGGGGGGPPMALISTMRHVSSRPYIR